MPATPPYRLPSPRDDPHGYGLCLLVSIVLLLVMLGIGAAFIFAGLMLLDRL